MSKFWKTHSISFVLLLISACSLDPVVIEPESLGDYYVFCTLAPSYEKQEVLIGKSVPENMPIAITDATVTISTDGQEVNFDHVGEGVY